MDRIREIAGRIDHTLLRADASRADMLRVCGECREHHFAMVAINGAQVPLCREALAGSGVHVGAAIGFPLGQMDLEAKVFEARRAIEQGADEIDYVVNLTWVKDGQWGRVEEEMRRMTALCRETERIIKVIFENCYLTREEIVALAEIARRVKPDFIKTSTGFGTGGARVEDVRLMKETVGPEVGVKAAGGIRTLDTLLAMEAAGATRFGTSAGVKIIEEARARLVAGGTL